MQLRTSHQPARRCSRNEAAGTTGIDERVAATTWRLSRGEDGLVVEAPEDDEDRCAGHDVGARRRHPRAHERWIVKEDRRLMDLHEAGWDEANLAARPADRRAQFGQGFASWRRVGIATSGGKR